MDNTLVKSVHQFIANYLTENDGLSPTFREIAKGCHIHLSTAAHCVDVLEAQGRVARRRNVSRSIRLISQEPIRE
jgi:DNA-binding MarR family transcriptional regulator